MSATYTVNDDGRDHERRTRFVNESRGPRMNDSALLLHYYYYYYYAVDGAISGAEGLTFVRAPDRTGSVRSTGSRRRLPAVDVLRLCKTEDEYYDVSSIRRGDL